MPFRRLRRGMDFPFGALTAEEVNNTGYVHVAEGVSAVNDHLDEYPEVVVYGDPTGVTWDATLEVPDNTTLDATPVNGLIPVSEAAISTYTKNTGTYATVATNKNRTDPQGVTVRGLDLDCSAVAALGDEDKWFGIWLDDGDDLLVEDCVVDGLAATSSDIGIVLSDDANGTGELRDSEAHNCGYDGLRVIGESDGSEIVRCGGSGNGSGTIQLTRWVVGNIGQPANVTFRDCWGERLYAHGYTDLGGIQSPRFLNCEADVVSVIGEVADVVVDGGELTRVGWFSNSDGETLDGLTVTGVTHRPDTSTHYIVFINHRDLDCVVTDITVKGCNAVSGRLLVIESNNDSSNSTAGIEFVGNVLKEGSRAIVHQQYVSGSMTVSNLNMRANRIEGTYNAVDGGDISGVRIRENTFVNITNIINDSTAYNDVEIADNTEW